MSRTAATIALRHTRRLSTNTTGISISKAKFQFPCEFDDPDKIIPLSTPLSVDLTLHRLAERHFPSCNDITQEPIVSSLIEEYGSIGAQCDSIDMFHLALQTYHMMDQLGTPRTSLSFNALLTACYDCKLFHNVPKLFDEITQQYRVVPDKLSYCILVKSFCKMGQPEKALEILKEVERKNVIEITAVPYTIVLNALYRKKKSEAEKLWSLMKEKHCVDVCAYNVRLKYVCGGVPDKVKAMIDEMVDAGLYPNTVTCNYLMTCYLKWGMVKKAKQVYAALFYESRCYHDAVTFDTLVFYLCRNGDFEGGLKVFKDSVEQLLLPKIPKFSTLKLLVQGLVKEGKKEEAKDLIRTVKTEFSFGNELKKWAKVERELNLSSDNDETQQASASNKTIFKRVLSRIWPYEEGR